MMKTEYKSQVQQDQFVDLMLKNKPIGTYVDIGSNHPVDINNTYVFDRRGWKGLCVDVSLDENLYRENNRSAHLVKLDATLLNYYNLFKKLNFPSTIDYLSLDIDEGSTDVLKILPHEEYRFGVITIEHDLYAHGDVYRNQQRGILWSLGYQLFASDVKVPEDWWVGNSSSNGGERVNVGFEDWWINPRVITVMQNKYPKQIIELVTSIA
jgi:hypothetical protein